MEHTTGTPPVDRGMIHHGDDIFSIARCPECFPELKRLLESMLRVGVLNTVHVKPPSEGAL